MIMTKVQKNDMCSVSLLLFIRVGDILDDKLAVWVLVLTVLEDGLGQDERALGQGLSQGLEVEINLEIWNFRFGTKINFFYEPDSSHSR